MAATDSAPQLNFRRALLIAAAFAAILNFIAFYPGLLHHDAWAYFDASRKNNWTNWQPPLLGFLWYPLRWIHEGPQPMLVLFVAGYWAGFVLIAESLRHEGRALAWLTFITAFFPLALNFNGQLVKDVSMGVCLLIGAGIAAGLLSGTIRMRAVALPFMWFFLVAGAFMRANSLFGPGPPSGASRVETPVSAILCGSTPRQGDSRSASRVGEEIACARGPVRSKSQTVGRLGLPLKPVGALGGDWGGPLKGVLRWEKKPPDPRQPVRVRREAGGSLAFAFCPLPKSCQNEAGNSPEKGGSKVAQR
jgi:hypothetical protein